MTKDAEMATRRARWGDWDNQFILYRTKNRLCGLAAEDRLRQLPPDPNLTRYCRGYAFSALEGGEYRLGYPEPL